MKTFAAKEQVLLTHEEEIQTSEREKKKQRSSYTCQTAANEKQILTQTQSVLTVNMNPTSHTSYVYCQE